MRGRTLITPAFVAITLLLGAGLAAPTRGQGLTFATQEELIGVPLASTPFAGAELPAAVDLSGDMPAPGFQGKQSSCVGWAVAYAMKSYQEKLEERQPYAGLDGRIKADRIFSPSFIYNQVNNGRDGGCRYQDALRLLSSSGAARWADMPYNEADFQSQPSDAAKTTAKRYRIDFWRQVNVADPKEIKAQLNAGYPVMIGAIVDEGFMKSKPGEIWKKIGGEQKGGHAMLLVGYDDRKSAFRVLNSWGAQWCDNGYGWIDYGFFPKVVREAYVAKDAINGPGPAPADPVRPADPRPIDPNPPVNPPVRPVADKLTFALTKVTQGAQIPNRPDLGVFLRFDGTLTIPPGAGLKNQTVIYFRYDAGGGKPGDAVASRMKEYADINGYAACGTAQYEIKREGTNTTWVAWVPYNAFVLPPGVWANDPVTRQRVYQRLTSNLIAQPVLFIDNFGVVNAPAVQFSVVGF